MKLVVIEAPKKQETIKKYLGSGYEVFATKGHIRDLAEKNLSVDIENNFEPKYVIMSDKKTVVSQLKQKYEKADAVYLATDPDREGEAISWHLQNILGIKETEPCRITFNEISKNAILKAMENPRPISKNLVDAYQARRVLDRLVGYKLSPYLSRKIKASRLSAGRVQSITLKLIVDREREIKAFKPEEFWNIATILEKDKVNFKASLYGEGGKKIKVVSKEQSDDILSKIKNAKYDIISVKESIAKSHPSAPFTTSTMQQDAGNKLGLSLTRTTRAAQSLYEGVDIAGEGKVALVTYIRTDSLRVSESAVQMAKEFIIKKYGENYYPDKPNFYKSKKTAQDAHEAIRPINLQYTPEKVKDSLQPDVYKLYKLIYERFVASQMAEATFNALNVEIEANGYNFKTQGKTPLFKGYTLAYGYAEQVKEDEEVDEGSKLPKLKEGDNINFVDIKAEQKFTKPSARFSESSIVKEMEDKGIGRPATYAPTIATLFARNYIEKDGKYVKPTELGDVVTDVLSKNFTDIMNVKFTADMEERLDGVESGESDWKNIIEQFYTGFEKALLNAGEDKEKIRLTEEITDEICEKCGSPMAIRSGKYGKFLGCTNYPNCKNLKKIEKIVGVCPQCGKPVGERKSKKGTIFYGCTGYPECKFISWDIPLAESCPKCNNYLTKKISVSGSKIKCSNVKCDYSRVESENKEV